MESASRTRLRAEALLTAQELAQAVGISPARLARLVDLDLVEPTAPGSSEFSAAAAVRLGRMLRLRADLGVRLFDAAIIVDLLERLDRVEEELIRLREGEG